MRHKEKSSIRAYDRRNLNITESTEKHIESKTPRNLVSMNESPFSNQDPSGREETESSLRSSFRPYKFPNSKKIDSLGYEVHGNFTHGNEVEKVDYHKIYNKLYRHTKRIPGLLDAIDLSYKRSFREKDKYNKSRSSLNKDSKDTRKKFFDHTSFRVFKLLNKYRRN